VLNEFGLLRDYDSNDLIIVGHIAPGSSIERVVRRAASSGLEPSGSPSRAPDPSVHCAHPYASIAERLGDQRPRSNANSIAL
jgi:hypothetical protein